MRTKPPFCKHGIDCNRLQCFFWRIQMFVYWDIYKELFNYRNISFELQYRLKKALEGPIKKEESTWEYKVPFKPKTVIYTVGATNIETPAVLIYPPSTISVGRATISYFYISSNTRGDYNAREKEEISYIKTKVGEMSKRLRLYGSGLSYLVPSTNYNF